MRSAVSVFFILFFSAFTAFAFEQNFHTVREYILKHPEQAWKLDSFTATVQENPVPLAVRNEKPVKIAIVYPAIQVSDYWKKSVNVIEKRLTELNINYVLITYFSKPSGDERLQLAQLAQAAKNGADFIILSAESPHIRKAVSRLILSGKHKIIIQNLATPLKEWDLLPPFLYTGFDDVKGASMLADAVVGLVGVNSDYAVLNCSDGKTGFLREKGFNERLLSYGHYNKKSEYIVDFDELKSEKAARAIIAKYPDISFIFSCSSDISIGAAKALKNNEKSKAVILNGWGGNERELKLISEQKIDLTVMPMNDDSSVAVAEAIKLAVDGREKDVPVLFSGDFSLITKNDSAEKIKIMKMRAFRYSGDN